MEHRCEIFVPRLYGRRRTPVEPEVMLLIGMSFNRQFGGHSPLGETGWPPGSLGGREEEEGGAWVDPETGETVPDKCILIRVYVAPEKLEAFEETAYAIGKLLEQKEVLIDIGEKTGKFLKIADDDEDESKDRQKKFDFFKDDEDELPDTKDKSA